MSSQRGVGKKEGTRKHLGGNEIGSLDELQWPRYPEPLEGPGGSLREL